MAVDLSTFAEVDPDDLASYLTAEGWVAEDPPAWTRQRSQLWVDQSGSEVLVPLRRGLRDYARLVFEACAVLADQADSEPAEILKHVAAVSFDTVRFRAAVDSKGDSLGLDDALALVTYGRSALSAVAASSVEPRASHPSRRPPEVEAYISQLQMAQTERGSFVVAVRSPVGAILPPSTESPLPTSEPDDEDVAGMDAGQDPPFTGRNVALLLLDAVDAASRAAAAYRDGAEISIFDDTIYDGVSSNLCTALAGLGGLKAPMLGLSVAWSPKVPLADQQASLRQERLLANDIKPHLKAGAEHLISLETLEPLVLTGTVTDLRRRSGAWLGQATIRADVQGRTRSVRLMLPLPDYLVVVGAHQADRRISAVGVPRRQGSYLVVDSPTDVTVL